jgi:hypothetical protein
MSHARCALATLLVLLIVGAGPAISQSTNPPQGPDINAVPFEFDPQHLNVVAAEWKGGIGCQPTFDVLICPATSTGTDLSDNFVAGLLLVKSGLTAQNASAGVSLTGVKGITLSELGYDIRKNTSILSDNGSHCGAGAPRFNVTTTDGLTHFIGCSSSATPPTTETIGVDWIRLRWSAVAGALIAFPTPVTSPVASISILFDEGQDAGPDMFGLAVLDNIDVNGQLIGTGPRGPAK